MCQSRILRDFLSMFPVPKKVAKPRKDGHVLADDADEDVLLLDLTKPKSTQAVPQRVRAQPASQPATVKHTTNADHSDTEPESDAESGAPNPPAPSRPESTDVDQGRVPGHI